ncbi:AAA family ATPase [Robiginitomaculum antarcticum]|uniref:AAA family ATPase n=1 Tax=Robiginitomaculum antarcticum TaxID=437507 RepID=UPI00037956CB|nr:AAA family ATPase [Robiginitomaculum antarcticum]
MKSWLKKKPGGTEEAPQGGEMSPRVMPQAVTGQGYGQQPQPHMTAPPPAAPYPGSAPAMSAPQGRPAMGRPSPMGAPAQMPRPSPMAPPPHSGGPAPQSGYAPQPPQGLPPRPDQQSPQGLPPRPAQQAFSPQHNSPASGQASDHPAPVMSQAGAPELRREGGERALPAISIHAFCERPETAGTVQATTRDWRMNRTNLKVYMGGLPAAVDFYHNENTPSLIMIESGMRGEELFTQLESLASVCDAGTKVVVIGAANDIRLYRELMDKGVSEYLVPPFHPLTLIRSMADLYIDPDKPFAGRVCAFFGAKGGVGSSTLAHNIAWIMSSGHNQETALVDLDASWGTTGLDFNYDSVQGLEEALASPDRLDETLLDRIMLRHSPTLSLLPAAASLNNAGMDSSEAYEAIVDGVRKISPMTILDMPHNWTTWSSNILKGSDDVIITAAPDLANLRNTKNLIEYLRAERPNDPDPIIILNKTGVPKTPEIPVKDFASALGIEPALVLPYEPVLYATASNDGKMLSEMKSDSKAVEGLSILAHRLRTGHAGGAAMKSGAKMKSSGGSLLSRLFKRG